jgi:FkbH-like protein
MRIVNYPLDSGNIIKRKKTFKRQLIEQSGLLEKRIAILSGSTIGDIKDTLEVFLLDYGIKPHFFIGQYSRFYEDVMFDNEELVTFKPELILIHTTTRNLSDKTIMDKLQAVWAKIIKDYSCTIIQNNFELLANNVGYSNLLINELNIQIAEYSEKNRDFFVNDIQQLSACLGLEKWFNEQDNYLYKYAFAVSAIPEYCHGIAKIVKSVYGKNQKCLVLDLDNTLWGGVVGDIGMMGVELGMETALGEAYVTFQKYVKELHNRGVLLAVCSKNDERIAKEAFNNPNMVLQLEDFAVFYANWDDKARNIQKIAKQLNVLPESLVFIDDNPAERELIRQALPNVKVPEVDSVVDYIQRIEWSGYFYATYISSDDEKRNEYYAADIKRDEAKSTFIDYGAYLRSLEMSSEICEFSPAHFVRITQLINKTNQFNPTTKRYNQSEIEKLAANPNYITICATLDDRFGSNGIVSVLIGEIIDNVLHIRLWVMSCRVFKRDLEFAVFDYLVDESKKKEMEKLVGYYYETSKNGYVASLFDDLGFVKVDDDIWEFSLDGEYLLKNKYIK